MDEKKRFPMELHEEELKKVSGGKRIQMCMPEKGRFGNEEKYYGYCPLCGSDDCQILYTPGGKIKNVHAVCWDCMFSFECDLPDCFTG